MLTIRSVKAINLEKFISVDCDYVQASDEIEWNGTEYRKETFVAMSHDDIDYLFGKTEFVIRNNYNEPLFFLNLFNTIKIVRSNAGPERCIHF